MPVLAYMQETMISAMLRFLLEMPIISSISGHAFFFAPRVLKVCIYIYIYIYVFICSLDDVVMHPLQTVKRQPATCANLHR